MKQLRPAMHVRLARRELLSRAAALAIATLPVLTRAQAYPTKPISLVVPWPAGGSTDRHMRLLAQLAGKHLGQNIIVVNQPGAGGTLGTVSVGQTAKPDGYTIALYTMAMLRLPHMQKTTWHPINDFSHIVGLSGYTFGMTVRTDSPYRTFNDYVNAARSQPGKIDYGTPGIGTALHLVMEELAQNARIELNHVPFKGTADLQQAVLGGHVAAQVDASGWDKFVDEGRMRLLVTFGDHRTRRWPNVPTAKELGYGVTSTSPYGLVAPKGLDPAIIKTLHDAFKATLSEPQHLDLLQQLNQELWYRDSKAYRQWALENFTKEKTALERVGLAANI